VLEACAGSQLISGADAMLTGEDAPMESLAVC